MVMIGLIFDVYLFLVNVFFWEENLEGGVWVFFLNKGYKLSLVVLGKIFFEDF